MADPQSKFVVSAEDRATAVLKKVSAEFGNLGKASSLANTVLGSFGKGFLASLAGGLSLGGLVAAVKSVSDLQDQFGKMAQKVGVGVQSLTELNYAAKLSDVSTEDLETGLTRLTSKMGDVAQGSKEATAVFDALGVKVKNNDGTLRSSEDVLKDIAQRFSEFKDGSTKTAFAVEIFGRSGAKLIPMLNAGRDGLAEMAEEARRLGIVFDEKAAKAAEQFNDNLTRLGQAAEGLKIELLQGLIPGLTEVTQRFLDARRAGLGFTDSLNAAADLPFFSNLDEEIKNARTALDDLNERFGPDAPWSYRKSIDPTGVQAEINAATARLRALEAVRRGIQNRETAQHRAGFSTSLFGRRGTVGAESPKFPQTQKSGKTDSERLAEEVEKLRERAAALGDNKVIEQAIWETTKGRYKALSDGEKQSLVNAAKALQSAMDAEDVEKQRVALIKERHQVEMQIFDTSKDVDASIAEELELEKRYQDLLGGTAQAEADRFIRLVSYIEQQRELGRVTADTAKEMKRLAAGLEAPLNEADEWAKQAARNIQDTLGDNLYNILDGNFENIGKSFGNLLKRMVAEATAANLARTLFGDYAKTGQIGGMFGSGLSWLGGLFGGGLSMRADGGPVSADMPYVVGERGREVFVPDTPGYVVPNHRLGGQSVQITQNISVGSGVSRADVVNAMSIAKEQAKREVYESMRRGGVFA